MGGGGRSPRSAGYGDSESHVMASRELMDGVLNPPKTLTLAVSETEVTLTADDGDPRHLRTDGRKTKAGDGSDVERKTRWEGESLVIETRVGSGPKLRETYSLASDGRSLEVLQRLESPGFTKPVELRRLYDPAAPPSGVQSVEPVR
jgi:hypothetical protein